MTEFKVGDRVIVDFPRNPMWNGSGEVIANDRGLSAQYLEVLLSDGKRGWFGPENLTRLPYEPRVGDRVRISHEVEVARFNKTYIYDNQDYGWGYDGSHYTIELIERGPEIPEKSKLPTTPGSVVKNPRGGLWVRSGEGRWVGVLGGGTYPATHLDDATGLTVLFDAGAAS